MESREISSLENSCSDRIAPQGIHRVGPAVTVVIPVYEDWDLARKCLSCLALQSFTDFEVLAVDNGSSHIPEIKDLPFPFQLLHCATPSSYAARNHGLSHATGGIIAFTDSDCLPDPKWLENGVGALNEQPELDLVAGHVDVFVRDASNPTAVELYNVIIMFPQERSVRDSQFGVTANLFVRREVVAAVGGFDARLKSSGDVEFCNQAVHQGFKLGYTPSAVVRHPARHDWQEILKTARRLGGGTMYRAMLESRYAALWMLVRITVPPVRSMFWICSRKKLAGMQKLKTLAVLAVFKWASWWEALRVLMGKAPSRS